jgi:CRP-like cAMP-binding protein
MISLELLNQGYGNFFNPASAGEGRSHMSVSSMLRGQDLFKSMTVEQVDKISGFSSLKKLQANETVYQSGVPATHVFLLIKGLVQLRLPAESGEFSMMVSKVEPGYLFGLALLIGGQRYTVTARCIRDCEILAIEAKPLHAMLRDNPLVGHLVMSAVAKAYSERYLEMLQRLQAILNQVPVIG